jgi:hypothetical protein
MLHALALCLYLPMIYNTSRNIALVGAMYEPKRRIDFQRATDNQNTIRLIDQLINKRHPFVGDMVTEEDNIWLQDALLAVV